MPLDTRAEFEFPTVHHAMPCEILLQFVSPLFIGPIGPDLCAFPQQSSVSSVMFSIFSLARSSWATWRGAVAMFDTSDMGVHMGYLSVHPEIIKATPAMPTTVLQNAPLKSACLNMYASIKNMTSS